MNLTSKKISDTYGTLLNKSGTSLIQLGNGSGINWVNEGIVAATGGDQIISGIKNFQDAMVAPSIQNSDDSFFLNKDF